MAFYCKRCHQPMRRVYSWFEHIARWAQDRCEGQHAYWGDAE